MGCIEIYNLPDNSALPINDSKLAVLQSAAFLPGGCCCRK